MVWEGGLDYCTGREEEQGGSTGLLYKQRGVAGGNMVWEGVLDYCTSREE